MKTRKNNPVKEYGRTFFLSFALALAVFFAINLLSGGEKLPPITLILSPHFDDAVLSLGGFMATSRGPIIVATFFTGKPTLPAREVWDERSGFQNSDQAVATRTLENIRALKQTGAHALNLNYLDFQYRSERSEASEEKIRLSIEKSIELMVDTLGTAEEISIYGPSEFGPDITHPDHKLLHDAFASFARTKSDKKNLRFFFYEDFPYVTRYRTSTEKTLRAFLELETGGISLREMPLPVGAKALEIKIKSLNDYASQAKAFESLGDNIIAETKAFTKSRCAKAKPAWYACEVVYEISAKV